MTAPKRAKRQQLRLAMALIGPSGSGKTVGGLILAYGMMKKKYPELDEYDLWGKIGLIDTEHERSLVYEGLTKGGVLIGQFWHKDMRPPYSAEAYTKAAIELKELGAEVIVVDSLSHAWTGVGGVLDYHDKGSFQNWNGTNEKAYNPLVSFAVGESTGIHTINTIRSKQSHEMVRDENGSIQVKKIGLQPVQRDQFEYEFQIALNVDMDHKSQASKDNSDIFEDFHDFLTPEHGAKLYEWLEAGVDIFAERRAAQEKAEQERLAKVAEIRQLEEEHYLQEYVASIEQHKGVNSPVEKMSDEWLGKLKGLMLQKIKDNQAKAKEEVK